MDPIIIFDGMITLTYKVETEIHLIFSLSCRSIKLAESVVSSYDLLEFDSNFSRYDNYEWEMFLRLSPWGYDGFEKNWF